MARSGLPIFIRERINHPVASSCARVRYRVRSNIHPVDLALVIGDRIPDPVPKGRRETTTRVSQELNLRDWLPRYRRNPVETVTDLTRMVQQIVVEGLEVKDLSR